MGRVEKRAHRSGVGAGPKQVGALGRVEFVQADIVQRCERSDIVLNAPGNSQAAILLRLHDLDAHVALDDLERGSTRAAWARWLGVASVAVVVALMLELTFALAMVLVPMLMLALVPAVMLDDETESSGSFSGMFGKFPDHCWQLLAHHRLLHNDRSRCLVDLVQLDHVMVWNDLRGYGLLLVDVLLLLCLMRGGCARPLTGIGRKIRSQPASSSQRPSSSISGS